MIRVADLSALEGRGSLMILAAVSAAIDGRGSWPVLSESSMSGPVSLVSLLVERDSGSQGPEIPTGLYQVYLGFAKVTLIRRRALYLKAHQ